MYRLRTTCNGEGRFGLKARIWGGQAVFLEVCVDSAPAAPPAALQASDRPPAALQLSSQLQFPYVPALDLGQPPTLPVTFNLDLNHNVLRFGFYSREGVYEYKYTYISLIKNIHINFIFTYIYIHMYIHT